MRICSILLTITLFHCIELEAQATEDISAKIVEINQMIDRAVVKRDITTLEKYYGEDFVFTHGTGQVDSKESWIKSIKKLSDINRYASREHDSTHVELHGEIAILTGTLTVSRIRESATTRYALQYVRVYALRSNVWQLISHRTTNEWHL
jgi:ketosteroid isomerase-like protein